jgi:hypothetical protein
MILDKYLKYGVASLKEEEKHNLLEKIILKEILIHLKIYLDHISKEKVNLYSVYQLQDNSHPIKLIIYRVKIKTLNNKLI